MNRYAAGVVDNPIINSTLTQIINLYQFIQNPTSKVGFFLNKERLLALHKRYALVIKESKALYPTLKLNSDNGPINVTLALTNHQLNIAKMIKIIHGDSTFVGFGTVAQKCEQIYLELNKRTQRTASLADTYPNLTRLLETSSGIYDNISINKMFSDPSLTNLKMNCLKAKKAIELTSPRITVAGVNLAQFFLEASKVMDRLNVVINGHDRKYQGVFYTSFDAMEMLEDLKTKI
jgi:hypothetical protein